MIDFKTLGTLDLRGSSGERTTSVLAHPKRVGLLLHLVLDQPGRPAERALLARRFWPDSPASRAAASFRNALSRLRRSFGPGVIESDAQQVRIVPEAISCDALRLLSAADAGRWEEAAGLATGPLAPGFDLDELMDFQRWLDGKRELVRRTALRSLRETAAHYGEDRLEEAEQLLTRASTFAPFDESLLLERLELFERRGDRAGAVRLFEGWRERFRTTLEMEPSPETVARYRELIERQAPAPGPPTPSSSPSPAPEAVVAADPEAASPGSAAPPTSAAAPPMPEEVPRPSADVGGRTGWSAGRASRWRLHAAAVAVVVVVVGLGTRLWSMDGGGEAEGIGARAPEAAEAALSGPPGAPDPRAVALSDSGMSRYLEGAYGEAERFFRDAVELDPDLVRAHYGSLLVSRASGRAGLSGRAEHTLARLRPFLTPGEAGRIDALLAPPDSARALYRALLEAEPDSLDLVLHLTELHFHWGSFWGVPRREVRAGFERLEAAGYATILSHQHLLRMDGAAGDLGAVRRRTRTLAALGAPPADIVLGRTLEHVLDPELPVDGEMPALAALPRDELTRVLGAVAGIPVHPDRVDRFFAAAYEAVAPTLRGELAAWNALAAAGRGRVRTAGTWIERLAEHSPARANEFRTVVATLPWHAPDPARWRAAARALESREPRSLISPFSIDFTADAVYAPRAVFLSYLTELPRGGEVDFARFDTLTQRTALDLRLSQAYRRILRARSLRIGESALEPALEALGVPIATVDGRRPWLLHHPQAYGQHLRARLLAESGRQEEARRFVDASPDPSGYDRGYLGGRLTLEGDLAIVLGDPAAARRAYRRAQAVLDGSDPEFEPLRAHIARQLVELADG